MELLHHGLIEGKAEGALHGDDVAVRNIEGFARANAVERGQYTRKNPLYI